MDKVSPIAIYEKTGAESIGLFHPYKSSLWKRPLNSFLNRLEECLFVYLNRCWCTLNLQDIDPNQVTAQAFQIEQWRKPKGRLVV